MSGVAIVQQKIIGAPNINVNKLLNGSQSVLHVQLAFFQQCAVWVL